MKQFIIKSISFLLQFLSRISVRYGITHPKVIIRMDGGICSQMLMYLNGQYYRNVAEVIYDTTWFEVYGKDLDGRFDRKQELTEMFPSLRFFTVDRKKSRFYKLFYSYSKIDGYLPLPDSIKRTTYFGGYYDMKPEDLEKLFACYFSANKVRALSIQLPDNQSLEGVTKVAVHIRRGDLAEREDRWYKKVPSSYFLNAISYVESLFPRCCLFFFSDEPEWVIANICPYVSRAPFHVIKGNKAFEDLYLISLCDVVIASQGSFGPCGARINGHSTLIKPSSDSSGGFSQVALF